jgi:N-acetylmuramoyl-L-alanine amidase
MRLLGGCLLLTILGAGARAQTPPLVVVVDPGHGGSNTGAPSPSGYSEKHVTLAVARMLRRRLSADGVRVILTRERDVYLTLGERVRRANAAGADLFLSLHANASPDHTQRGFETYVVAREVADVAATRAASSESDPVRAMIARAGARRVAEQSARLARAMQARLAEVRAGDRGVRQAPYDVLDGVRAPAVLVEVGFIDHPVEGPELFDGAAQSTIAEALARAILDVARPDPRLAQR